MGDLKLVEALPDLVHETPEQGLDTILG